MGEPRNKIQVFEHGTLYYGNYYEETLFTKQHFDQLTRLNDLHRNKYFTILHNGIRFSHYVGILQVDELCIEVLPKSDYENRDKAVWQSVLIDMLKVTKKLRVENTGTAYVNKQQVHLLDIYFEWFLNEVSTLIRNGLIKQYYKETTNIKALKGKLEFSGHIQRNSIHKERFYTTHNVYRKDHLIHQILNCALQVIEHFSNGTHLYGKCKSIQLDFPEVSTIRATSSTFSKIIYSRKTAPYKTALELARLIILNYAPNIISGGEKMLALMFNMNMLWEEYVLIQLKNHTRNTSIKVSGQESKAFWNNNSLRPDVVIRNGSKTYILDTKWKRPTKATTMVSDLRQMYAYCRFWDAKKALLLYPGKENKSEYESYKTDDYQREDDNSLSKVNHQCKMGFVSVLDEKGNLSTNFGERILALLENE